MQFLKPALNGKYPNKYFDLLSSSKNLSGMNSSGFENMSLFRCKMYGNTAIIVVGGRL